MGIVKADSTVVSAKISDAYIAFLSYLTANKTPIAAVGQDTASIIDIYTVLSHGISDKTGIIINGNITSLNTETHKGAVALR